MPQLLTNWIRIATAGNAIDGRVILDNVIQEMADTYNPDEYTARIWPDHRRWFGAWGDVVALKAEEWQGKLRLFARLRPNSQLMQANEMDQKTFCSIEINVKDFDGTGKHYLGGLGVTDEPGSLGTEKLKFCKATSKLYSEPEHFVIEEVTEENTEKTPAWRKLFSFSKPKPTEDTDVTEEQLRAALQGALEPFASRLDAIEQQFSAPPEGEETEPGGDQGSDTPTAPTVEQFSAAVTDAIKPLADKLSGLETQFNTLLEEAPDQRPSGEGADDNTNVEAF
ncbi:GPO family capsid scaffolding protein [Grimontia hollisae]|uniref:GPO family capsid scaffolding protein n=1 Tax=Grimontia hollisae TaxID=673 RepID=UPI001303CFFF|nr:GPO family capsid scaffolding protein [Grimontia hollisae]